MARVRRRLAAIATCFVLVFATFGYMHRNAAEAVHEAQRTAECDQPKRDRPVLCLYDG
jgi:hypothetical protein